MVIKEFRIEFDNEWSTYYPGQTMTGNVIVVLDSPKVIRSISVKIKGEANVSWVLIREDIDSREHGYLDEYATGHEEYFETKYYLYDSNGDKETEMGPGEHIFPFTCSLPSNLPSSFESEFGNIRYTVKATLDRPWKFDHDVKKLFTVITPLDLNKEPKANESVQEEMSKAFCCLCCSTSPLAVNFSLPARGYVPGQSIPVKINVENLSNIDVNTIKLELCKTVTVHSTLPRSLTHTFEIVESNVSKGPVEAHGTADYVQYLDVPPLPPSNLANCNIIDLEYYLKVEACVIWYHRNLSAKTLVFIGSIPLSVDYAPSAPAEIDSDYTEDKPPEAGFIIPSNTALFPLPESNLYLNLPPLSVKESTHAAINLREEGESEYVYGLNDRFAPKYPVYNFASAQ